MDLSVLLHNSSRFLHFEYLCKKTLCGTKTMLSTRIVGLLYVCYFNFILFYFGDWKGRFLCRSEFSAKL